MDGHPNGLLKLGMNLPLAEGMAKRDRRVAEGWMLGSALALSLMPLAVDLGASGSNPLMFHFGLTVGELAGLGGYVAIRYRHLVRPIVKAAARSWRIPARRRFLLVMGSIGAVANFDYAVFAWGAERVDTAVPAMLIETWPLWYVAGMTLCDRLGLASGFGATTRRRYQALSSRQLAATALAVAGVSAVIWSAGGHPGNGRPLLTVFLGCAAALFAGVLTSLAWSQIVAGTAIASDIRNPRTPDGRLNEACVLAVTIASTAVSVPVGIGSGVATGWDITSRGLAVSLVAGLVLLPAAIICFRQSNLTAADLSVNAVSTAGPLLALIWLSLFTTIEIAHPAMFAGGAVAVVAARTAVQRLHARAQASPVRPIEAAPR